MICSINKDRPMRIRLTKAGVVHAAAYSDYGPFTRYHHETGKTEHVPKQKRLTMACRWKVPKESLEKYLVPSTNKITCKLCMKYMGMDEGPVSPRRYVVRNKDTGEFMKNTNSRCSGWSDSISDAFLFRAKHTAKDKCKVTRYKVGNKLMTYVEWANAGRPKNTWERIDDPNMEVKSVKIILE